MFNFFKKKDNFKKKDKSNPAFEIELTAEILAYEIARSDGKIDNDELNVLMEEIKIVSKKVKRNEAEILKIIEKYSKDSVSFYEFVEEINDTYDKDEKLSLLKFMWKIAYADGRLDIDEERLIRRLADLIKIKDMDVLKLKNLFKDN